jgi:geranylgeranyl pyrophosphate synthase
VLVGDVLLCEAMRLVVEGEERLVRPFLSKVREVCLAEAEQEIPLRGATLDEETCLRIARSKTGPLFAFVGLACGGEDARLSSALEEAGYRLGTAYQLFDDLVDVLGDEGAAKKTLGTDARRRKFTLPQTSDRGPSRTAAHVERLLGEAVECAAEWPEARAGLEDYVARDLGPVLESHLGPWGRGPRAPACRRTGGASRRLPARQETAV